MTIAELAAEAAACCRCSAASDRKALSEANGPVPCGIMLVGEAPGRLGAGKTGVPFTLDVSALRLERLMAEAGLRREDVFITNALLCGPLSESGLNRAPRTGELRACSEWLARQIDLVEPDVVVAMGVVALRALGLIESHSASLKTVGRPTDWLGRTLVPMYHPGARAGVHRSWEMQVEDWRRLGSLCRREGVWRRMNTSDAVRRDTLPYEESA